MKACIFLFFSLLLFSCNKTQSPNTTGYYYIENATSAELKVRGTFNGQPVPFMDSVVAPVNKELIYIAHTASNGNVLPAALLSSFMISMPGSTGDSVIYNKVDNADWITEHLADGTTIMTRKVQ